MSEVIRIPRDIKARFDLIGESLGLTFLETLERALASLQAQEILRLLKDREFFESLPESAQHKLIVLLQQDLLWLRRVKKRDFKKLVRSSSHTRR